MQPSEYTDILEIARGRVEDFKRLCDAGLLSRDGDFFPSVHYPPITMYSPITEEELFRTYTLPEDGLFDVYAHLPFCHQRCIFCHYPVKFGDQSAEKDRYLNALEKEMDLYMCRLGVDKIKARSILVGGGTPTYLSPKQLQRFLEFFCGRLDMSGCTQFNYDVDPNTLLGPEGRERLQIMRSYGVDRLTIGVQSLDDHILQVMNRHHDARKAIESIEASRELGYQINIEFIFGHPGQTIDNWIKVVEQAVTLGVEEIQLYRLKVEAYGDYQGPIKVVKQREPEKVPDVTESLMMKQIAIEILNRNGYHENIRRVFTRHKKYYSHYAWNQCCNLYDEIGLGLTAFSSLRDRFGLNTQYFEEYYDSIDNGRLPLNRGLVRSPDEQMRWAIILPLKNSRVRKDLFEKATGIPFDGVFRAKVEALKAQGLAIEDEGKLELTKLGAFFADECAQLFHSPAYVPFPTANYASGPLNPYLNGQGGS